MEKWEGMSMRVSCFEPSPQKRPRREESGGGGGGGDDDVEVQWIQAQVPVNIPKVQKPGTRYNIEEERLEIVEDQIEEDREREVDEMTMKVFGDIANSIDPAIQVEIDFPSKKPDKMTMDNDNMVKYKFYRKPQSNKYTMMERSALSNKTKRSTLTDMAMTRLLCCSPNLEREEVVEVMKDFARMMRRSGFCQKFRHEVITDAIKGPDGGSGGHPVDDYDQKTEERRGHCCSESSEILTIGDFDSIHLCI